jgi:hypothetical protein
VMPAAAALSVLKNSLRFGISLPLQSCRAEPAAGGAAAVASTV